MFLVHFGALLCSLVFRVVVHDSEPGELLADVQRLWLAQAAIA